MRMKKITDASSLIDWLQERILEMEPQRQVSNGVIALFKEFTEDIKFGSAGGLTLELENVISVMKANPGSSKGYKKLESVFASFGEYAEFTNPEFSTMDPVEMFIRLMVEELGFNGKGLLLSH